MIAVRSLVASSGPFRLSPTTLDLESGELLVLLGPSGAGKTVLLEALLGLREVHSGTTVIEGRDVTGMPPEARHVAYMPQDVALFPHLSVRENIEFGRRVRGQCETLHEDVARLAESLDIIGLLARTSVHALSGGEAQRVALARALITHPRVLFLDESFSALDAHIRSRLLLQFRALQQELKLTAIYVTHNLGEAALVADRIAVLIDGSIVQISEAGRLFREPCDLRVALFLQLDNLHRIEPRGGTSCRIGAIDVELAKEPSMDGTTWIAFSSSDVMLVHPGDEGAGLDRNRFAGSVLAFEKRHDHSRIQVAIGVGRNFVVDCDVTARDRVLLGEGLAIGAEVQVHVPPDAIAVFPETST
jgi:ABC-type Fe3+/spermidine/putrescine transport system ATPase subunit